MSPEPSELSKWVESENIQRSARQEKINAFTAGWVVRKILQKIKCACCEENLTSRELNYCDNNTINDWISFREYKSVKERNLTYPTKNVVRLFGIIIEEAKQYLKNKPERNPVIKILKIISNRKYLFDFINCELHKDAIFECFLEFTLGLTVFNWCNVINKILKGMDGKDVSRLESKPLLPQMQLKALNKFKTKLKNKKKLK